MKKTLFTVLITLAAAAIVVLVVVLIVNNNKAKPSETTSDLQQSTTSTELHTTPSVSDEAASEESTTSFDESDLIYAGMTREELYTIIGKDIFDWNAADDEAKAAIIEDIHRVWNESAEEYSLSVADTIEYVNSNLYDQCIIFDLACAGEGIDSSAYHSLFNESDEETEDSDEAETSFDESDLIYEGMSRDELQSIISYDIFDWNSADMQGKELIVENIHRVWNESGETYALSVDDTVAQIDSNLSDQAIIFDIACSLEGLDASCYHALFQ